MRRLASAAFIFFSTACFARGQTNDRQTNLVSCACDPAKPETMAARPCSLCREAENRPGSDAVFLLKDNNPNKPNRWLALPRSHAHSLAAMTQPERTALWNTAAAKGKEMFGDGWALAVNGRKVVTQCHTHIHIGKLLSGIETNNFLVVSSLDEIPVPENEGFWVHPEGARFHVHRGEQITETILLR